MSDFNPRNEMASLKAEKAVLEQDLKDAKKAGNQHNQDNIYKLLSDNQQAQTAFGTQIEKDIIMPVTGWHFAADNRGTIEYFGALVGVPLALWYSVRTGRVAWFKYRHARAPFPPKELAFYCQKFELPIASYKDNTHVEWKGDAAKSATAGGYSFLTTVWSQWRQQADAIQVVEKKAAATAAEEKAAATQAAEEKPVAEIQWDPKHPYGVIRSSGGVKECDTKATEEKAVATKETRAKPKQ
jgi:hypothetical protein